MAATLTLTAATSYGLKYAFAYDGTGGAGSGTASKTQAQLIADLAAALSPSPLRDLLQSITTDAAWNALPTGPKLSLYMQMRSQLRLLIANIETTLGGRVLTVSATDGQATFANIEIRFHHTIDR